MQKGLVPEDKAVHGEGGEAKAMGQDLGEGGKEVGGCESKSEGRICRRINNENNSILMV